MQDGLSVVSEARVAGEDLQGRHKKRKTKEERMKSVLEGDVLPSLPVSHAASSWTCLANASPANTWAITSQRVTASQEVHLDSSSDDNNGKKHNNSNSK